MRPILLALLLLCAGCASPLAAARTSYAAARSLYDTAEPQIEARYEREQIACLEPPTAPDSCVADVRRRWALVKRAANALHASLLAAGASLGAYDALSSGGRAPAPADVLKALDGALDAAEALSRAVRALGAP